MAIKLFGYVIALIGVFGLAASTIAEISSLIPDLNKLGDTLLLTISIALLVIGILLVMKSSPSPRRVSEVPIYHENKVVGFRRVR